MDTRRVHWEDGSLSRGRVAAGVPAGGRGILEGRGPVLGPAPFFEVPVRSRVFAAALLAAFLVSSHAPTSPPVAAAGAKPELGTFGVDTTQMDRSVKPGDDFFAFVNGTWLRTFTMPADKARYGMFDALGDKAETDVRSLLDELGT